MSSPHRQAGFALVAAVVLLTLVLLATAVLANLSGAERGTTDAALLQARAYAAAHAGVEWGISRALNSGSCVAGPTTFTLTEASLAGFDVSVSCTSSVHREQAQTANVYRIRSQATRGVVGDRDYAARSIEATLSDAP